jgi:hypothetical protein
MRGHRVRRLGGRAAGVRRPYYIADCGSGRITRRPLSRFRRCPDRIRWVDGPRGGESAGGVDCPWRRHLLVLFGLPGFIASANLAAGGAVHTNHFLRVFELNAQASAHRLWKHALHGGSSRASASRDRPAVATLYGLVSLYGFLGGSELAGLVQVNASDNVLHVVLSGVALGPACLTSVRRAQRVARSGLIRRSDSPRARWHAVTQPRLSREQCGSKGAVAALRGCGRLTALLLRAGGGLPAGRDEVFGSAPVHRPLM